MINSMRLMEDKFISVDGILTSCGATCRLYFTRVKLGNPAKEFYVQIDTGSDILWVACSPCDGCPTSSGLNVRPLDSYIVLDDFPMLFVIRHDIPH
jgi:Xylanase inhibitor N-terminal